MHSDDLSTEGSELHRTSSFPPIAIRRYHLSGDISDEDLEAELIDLDDHSDDENELDDELQMELDELSEDSCLDDSDGSESDHSDLEEYIRLSHYWKEPSIHLSSYGRSLVELTLQENSYLRPGRVFLGTQNLINHRSQSSSKEEWEVKVTIHAVDHKSGTVVGLMEALNVPATTATVLTYWDGEIIDFVNHGLWTEKWQATRDIDLQHWRMFKAFKGVDSADISHGADSVKNLEDIHRDYIFMRWKERFFVNVSAQDSGLTIAGFYYVCLRRCDGLIEGFYFDPSSTPYQRLLLKPKFDGRGVSFSSYTFA
ncbi:hypothetical protein K493DRAFT_362894 [Basidiobolus meristosporus CBS 931.73]|uniref:Vacuolar import and degradation protein n=1 Tax=Basidiobolus meristosporus CBS 931.73 TaxID=1314790 RepID=A0A1Y1WYL7_9FUNG|nr:hypothetical protein K493DRAFT_362894 [Basidiobolus meristosporus CBS 931.73]|eukprot:ORX78593.1 hypothetical protein K493DRAFT_362894 [Basidiobolus meristosporus CBS 931.73]